MSGAPHSVQAVDQTDKAISILETTWLAMQATGLHDEAAIEHMADTLMTAISALKPVREALNGREVEILI